MGGDKMYEIIIASIMLGFAIGFVTAYWVFKEEIKYVRKTK